MYKNILIPVDVNHADAIKNSISLAKKLLADEGTVTLLSVIEELPTYVAVELPPELLEKQGVRARDKLVELAEASEMNSGIKVINGSPSTAILNHASNENVDLIIIASHRPELMDYLLGSTAAKVVRHAKCAVHVTR